MSKQVLLTEDEIRIIKYAFQEIVILSDDYDKIVHDLLDKLEDN